MARFSPTPATLDQKCHATISLATSGPSRVTNSLAFSAASLIQVVSSSFMLNLLGNVQASRELQDLEGKVALAGCLQALADGPKHWCDQVPPGGDGLQVQSTARFFCGVGADTFGAVVVSDDDVQLLNHGLCSRGGN